MDKNSKFTDSLPLMRQILLVGFTVIGLTLPLATANAGSAPRARIGATSHCPASAPHRHARLSPALRSCLQSRDTDFTG
jgi:hypothetical protein